MNQSQSSNSDDDEEEFTGLDSFYHRKTAHLWAKNSFEDDDDDDESSKSKLTSPRDANGIRLENPFEDPFIRHMRMRTSAEQNRADVQPLTDISSNSIHSHAEKSLASTSGNQLESDDEEEIYQELPTSLEATSWSGPLRSSTGPSERGKRAFYRKALASYKKRIVVLVILFVLQSASSEILQRYDKLISQHIIIAVFLTCLIGAGGNAGSQTVMNMVSHMLSHRMTPKKLWNSLKSELAIGLLSAFTLAFLGFFRAWITVGNLQTHLLEVLALAITLFTNVLLSVLIGTLLPYGLTLLKLDPSHASPVIQVTMDIIGVLVTCTVCSIILNV